MPQLTHTIITANQRLATRLSEQYDHTQLQQGKTAWESLDCLPLNRWLERAYQYLKPTTVLLSDIQALARWESIIAADCRDTYPGLFHSRTLAKTAYRAWQTLLAWQVPLTTLVHSHSAEVAAFYRWASTFQRECSQQQWLDQAMATHKVIDALMTQTLPLPQQITLAGFAEIPPQIQQLFHQLAAQCVLHYDDEKIRAHCQHIAANNEEHEWRMMAQWAYQQWQQTPQLRIGCVVPRLDQVRDDVVRIFAQTQNALSDHPPADLVNISGGDTLSHFPLIQSAFDILQLAITPLATDMLSRLFRAPFLGGAEQEIISRSQLDVQLREYQEAWFEWPVLLQWLQRTGICPDLLARCSAYVATLKPVTAKHSLRDWAQYFIQQLTVFGWPGERTLSSAEYQQAMRWQQLLQEFASLEWVLETPLSFTQALKQLQTLARETLFQIQTPHAPIQVLGLLEAVGLNFDRLWVCGMTQEDWPAAPAPNPFLPIRLQRQHNMPHASAERELAFSQSVTTRFRHSAEQVIMSYASLKEDRPQTPSRLIADIALVDPAQLLSESFISHQQPAVLEYLRDEQAPALANPDTFRSSANLFKHQAACAFRAFAGIRLGAAALQSSTLYLRAAERGIILHSVLEQLWSILRDQATLSQYEPAALDALITRTVQSVLNQYAQQRRFALQPQLLRLEQQRVVELAQRWLALERQRPAFRVASVETQRSLSFAGLNLTLRIDREDELANGARILIDYKTGNCHVGGWFGIRPDDPQMPLYGITSMPPVEGLMFAQITTQAMQFKGISAQDYEIDGVIAINQQNYDTSVPLWDNFYQQQTIILTQLAEQFKNGDARVDPKHGQITCQYCDLRPLCRIDERQ